MGAIPAPMVSTLGHAVARQRLRAALLGEEVEPVRVDRFALLRELGQGGMGTVWLAHDEQLDRRIALKFLRSAATSSNAEQLLFEEAQNLAKLSHPHVVPVYDVGRHEGRVWIAMEFVPGRTLRQWVDQQDPSRRQRLAAWLAAGRGLAAVHDAGLVHRDIKPDNVMMGDDDRVRLIDFGLVRAVPAERVPADTSTTQAGTRPATQTNEPEASRAGEPEPTTHSRHFVGTPAYAAPEQHGRGPVDAHADQYAFCVSVWEALSGQRPPAPSDDEPPLRGPPVPARIRRVLQRGLQPRPQDRFESMGALLAALEPPRRTWVLPTITAVVAGGLGLSTALQSDTPQPCAQAGTEIAQTWSDESREQLRARFSEPVAARVGGMLDQWTQRWSDTAQQSCQDVHVRQLYSTEALDRRGLCLDDARVQLQTLLEGVENAEIRSPTTLATWLEGLDDPTRCSSPAVLRALAPSPPPEHEAELATLQRQLIRARLGADDLSFTQRIDTAQQIYDRATQLGWGPLLARATVTLGTLLLLDGRATPARRWYGRALDQGHALRDLEVLTRAHSGLAQVELLLELDESGAQWQLERQAALVHSLGDRPESVAQWRANEGDLHRLRGDLPAAQRASQDAVDAWEQAGERYGWSLATALRQLADIRADRGHHDQAAALLERARDLEQLHDTGAMPPAERHTAAFNEGLSAFTAGQLEKAEALLREAIEASIVRQGPRGIAVARAHAALAGVYDAMGNAPASREHATTADAILAATVAPDHPERGAALTALGLAEFRAGQLRSAAEIYRRALAIGRSRLPPGSVDLAVYRLNLGETLLELSDYAAARRQLGAAHEVFERELPGDHPYLAITLKSLGTLALRDDDPAAAVAWLRRAAAIFEQTPSNPLEQAQVQWRLARAEAATGSAPDARARGLQAARTFESLGPDHAEQAAQIRRWVDTLTDPNTPTP